MRKNLKGRDIVIEKELVQLFPWVDEMEEENRTLLLSEATGRRLRKGPLSPDQLQARGSALFLISGRLRFYLGSNEGKTVTVFTVGAGQLCRLPLELAQSGEGVQVMLEAERESVAALLPEESFGRLVRRDRQFERMSRQSDLEFIQGLLAVIHQISFQTVDLRLCDRLLELSEGSSVIRVTQSSLAADLGVTREFVCKTLRGFEEAGALSTSRGKITIHDRGYLEAYRENPQAFQGNQPLEAIRA